MEWNSGVRRTCLCNTEPPCTSHVLFPYESKLPLAFNGRCFFSPFKQSLWWTGHDQAQNQVWEKLLQLPPPPNKGFAHSPRECWQLLRQLIGGRGCVRVPVLPTFLPPLLCLFLLPELELGNREEEEMWGEEQCRARAVLLKLFGSESQHIQYEIEDPILDSLTLDPIGPPPAPSPLTPHPAPFTVIKYSYYREQKKAAAKPSMMKAQLLTTWAGLGYHLLVPEVLHQLRPLLLGPLWSSLVVFSLFQSCKLLQPHNSGFVSPLESQLQGWRTLS